MAKANWDALLWAISGPKIVWPGYEDLEVPNDIRANIPIERLLMVIRNMELASEVETMWYLSTASLARPFDSHWCQIQLYLARRYQLAHSKPLPDFLQKRVVLDDYTEKRPLRALRQWLYQNSIQAMKEAERSAKKKRRPTRCGQYPLFRGVGANH